ncbi:hypothetical protein GW916_01560 [bacterium]|nr:hypothetical protein [bacterium]
MSIRGIDRVQAFLGGIIDAKGRSVNAQADRDAQREEQERRRKSLELTPAQVEEAFQALLKSLSGTDLRAEKKTENGKPHFQVLDRTGKVIRDLRLGQITDLYLKSKSGEADVHSGTLLKRSA